MSWSKYQWRKEYNFCCTFMGEFSATVKVKLVSPHQLVAKKQKFAGNYSVHGYLPSSILTQKSRKQKTSCFRCREFYNFVTNIRSFFQFAKTVLLETLHHRVKALIIQDNDLANPHVFLGDLRTLGRVR